MCPRAPVAGHLQKVSTYVLLPLRGITLLYTGWGFRLSFFPDGQILSHERERERATPTSYPVSASRFVGSHKTFNEHSIDSPTSHPLLSLSLSRLDLAIRVTKLDRFPFSYSILNLLVDFFFLFYLFESYFKKPQSD